MSNAITRTGIARRTVLAVGATLLARPARADNSSWNDIAASGKVRVGVIAARPPYFWRDESGEWTGFSAQMGRDVTAAVAKEMSRPLEISFVETTWPTVILDIQANRLDVFFGLTFSEERAKAISLFGPLYALPEVVLTAKGFDPGPNWSDYDKPGTNVSVVLGTTDEQAARQMLPHATIRAMKGMAEAVLDVQSGNGQALVTTVLTGLGAMKVSTSFGAMKVLEPEMSQPSDGGTRNDGDGKLAGFLRNWAVDYRKSGRAKEVILTAMRTYGLDVNKLPPTMKF